MTTSPLAAPATWLAAHDCRVSDLQALVEQRTELAGYPFADRVESNVLLYDGDRLRSLAAGPERRALQAELAGALQDGPGIVVLQQAFPDRAVVDRATGLFTAMVADQHARGVGAGDHLARPGANDRVWNALEKLAVRDPEAFADYYANDLLALVAEAWLGPAYQVTSQVDVVNPGGEAQQAHRGYHLGFLPATLAARYPAHVHRLSPALTLQGAVAHGEMPVESGPTMYLPHSQKYLPGYLAVGMPDFRDYFASNHVQLPLATGDAVFFNPALFHAAGHNRSADVRRMANLLQVSSAFGRAMESVDRARAATAVFPVLRSWWLSGAPAWSIDNVIAATAEGYPFPTNLDLDPPVDGLAPPAQADLLRSAVEEGWSPDLLDEALAAHAARRTT